MLEAGITGQQTMKVEKEHTAEVMKSGTLAVFATPAMVALIEETAWKSVAGELEEGCVTVGTSLNIRHLSASPVGMLREFFPVISDRCYLIISKSNCQRFFCFLFISDNSFNSPPSLTFSVLFPHPKQSIIYLGFYIETRHTDDMFSVL